MSEIGLEPSPSRMKKTESNGGDRVSTLPEQALTHILSFVTTRQAVQTSILSMRWRHLWKSIPVLHFNEYEFPKFHGGVNTKFLNFIDQVLFLRWEDENIRKFHLSAFSCIYASHVREFMLHATRGRNIEELVVELKEFGDDLRIELPSCVFASGSLRVLRMEMSNWVLKLPNALSPSGLTSLHLAYIASEDDSLGRLISNCPFLEDLHLEACHFSKLNICGDRIKKLSILGGGSEDESTIQVSAFSLQSFKYKLGKRQFCSLENLVSLVEADIEINQIDYLSDDNDNVNIVHILGGLSTASVLNFSYWGFEHLCLEPELLGRLPLFYNLTYLKLNTWFNKDHIEVIINILQRTPNLKTLVINNQRPYYWFTLKQEEEHDCWTPKDPSPQFLLHLREIKVTNFECAMQQEFLKFLLRSTRFVKGVTIIPGI